MEGGGLPRHRFSCLPHDHQGHGSDDDDNSLQLLLLYFRKGHHGKLQLCNTISKTTYNPTPWKKTASKVN